MNVQTIDRHALLATLRSHIGEESGIHADQLAAEYCGDDSPAAQRRMRSVIEDLRRDGHHICGTPATGYFLARTPEELDATCTLLYDRAMTSLTQVAAMRRVSLPDLKGQLRLPG